MVPQTGAWVFVSHASADLVRVRQVRNFIEDNGGGPILFYLRSLTAPEKFWPLIEQEIAARNFFLFCDSKAAEESTWVRRERDAVADLSRQRPIRVGRISVDDDNLDFDGLKRFIRNLKVYIAHPADFDPNPVFRTLEEFGYDVLGSVGFSPQGLEHLGQGGSDNQDLMDMMAYGASEGWLLVLLNQAMSTSPALYEAIPILDEQRTIFVATDPVAGFEMFHKINGALFVEEKGGLEDLIRIAAKKMLLGRDA
jgi:hypothetical protein